MRKLFTVIMWGLAVAMLVGLAAGYIASIFMDGLWAYGMGFIASLGSTIIIGPCAAEYLRRRS